MPEPLFSDPEAPDAGAVRFRAPRGGGDVLSAAFQFVGAEAWPLGRAVLAIAGPLVLASALLQAVGGTSAGDTLVSLTDIAVSVVLASAVLAYVRQYRAGTLGAAEVADVWDETKALLGPVAVVVGAGLVALIALVIPFSILVAGLFVLNEVLGVVAGVVLGLAALAVVVPLFTLSVVAAGLDGLGPADAMRRALALARGEWSLVLGTLALVLVVAGAVLVLVGGGLAASLGLDRVAEPGLVGVLATALVSILTLPVNVAFTVVYVLLYGSLVARAEGGPLGADVAAIARPAVQPPREVPERPGDALARRLDEAPRDTSPRDSPPRDSSPRDSSPRDGFRGGADRPEDSETDARS